MYFLQKKWKFFVKCGLGSRSNILLPRIGGSHPVPSLSLLLTERRGYSNVLASFSLVLIIHWSSHKCGHKRKTFCIYGKTSHVLRCILEDNSSFCSHCYVYLQYTFLSKNPAGVTHRGSLAAATTRHPHCLSFQIIHEFMDYCFLLIP